MKTMVKLPTVCPSCGGVVELDEKEVSLWCRNLACPAQLARRVLHYVKTLEVFGVGSGIIDGLCQNGFVKDLPDLYYLTMAQLQDVTGGTRAAEKVQVAILEKNQIPLAVFLDSLGIDGLGTTTSKAVAAKFKTLESVRKALGIEFADIDGVAHLTAGKIECGLRTMSDTIDRLAEVIEIKEVVEVNGTLTGKSFCMTGALPSGTKREVMAKRIEVAGGIVKDSVGKGLNFLVQADVNSTSSKSQKARNLGVKIISEDELIRMMGA